MPSGWLYVHVNKSLFVPSRSSASSTASVSTIVSSLFALLKLIGGAFELISMQSATPFWFTSLANSLADSGSELQASSSVSVCPSPSSSRSALFPMPSLSESSDSVASNGKASLASSMSSLSSSVSALFPMPSLSESSDSVAVSYTHLTLPTKRIV